MKTSPNHIQSLRRLNRNFSKGKLKRRLQQINEKIERYMNPPI